MTSILILMLMLLAHIVEDFHLQGIMASMKQKSWWKKQLEGHEWDSRRRMYRNDHVPVLLLHGFEWAMCVSIPCLADCWFDPCWEFCAAIVVMALLHSYIDHLKANRLTINLVQDQCLHMVQILILFGAYLVL